MVVQERVLSCLNSMNIFIGNVVNYREEKNEKKFIRDKNGEISCHVFKILMDFLVWVTHQAVAVDKVVVAMVDPDCT